MAEYVKLLCEAAEKYADNIAITDRKGTRSSDYKTFGKLMRQTAAWIHEKRLEKRSFIPVRFVSSLEYAAAVCGEILSG